MRRWSAPASSQLITRKPSQEYSSVNGYDMADVEVGKGPPLVCVHGTLGDSRTWLAASATAVEQAPRDPAEPAHLFRKHGDGVGDDYLMAQHVSDVIGFIEKFGPDKWI